MRGVPGQVLHLHGEPCQHRGHRLGQEVLAPVNADLARQPTRRPVRLLEGDGCAQRGQDALPLAGSGVTAVPHTTFVAASTNHVTHGLSRRPSTSTSTGASTWSASHTSLRCPRGRCRNTSCALRASSPLRRPQVVAQDVASHSPLQRLAARRRRTTTLGRLDQLPVHCGNVAPPERQPLPQMTVSGGQSVTLRARRNVMN